MAPSVAGYGNKTNDNRRRGVFTLNSSHNMLSRFFTFATVVQTLNFDNACSPYPYDQQSYHCFQNLVRTYHHWVVYFGVAVSYTATNTFILENISRSHETATYTKINYSTVICARRFDNNLNDHMRSKHDQSSYNCGECEETFEDTESTYCESW